MPPPLVHSPLGLPLGDRALLPLAHSPSALGARVVAGEPYTIHILKGYCNTLPWGVQPDGGNWAACSRGFILRRVHEPAHLSSRCLVVAARGLRGLEPPQRGRAAHSGGGAGGLWPPFWRGLPCIEHHKHGRVPPGIEHHPQVLLTGGGEGGSSTGGWAPLPRGSGAVVVGFGTIPCYGGGEVGRLGGGAGSYRAVPPLPLARGSPHSPSDPLPLGHLPCTPLNRPGRRRSAAGGGLLAATVLGPGTQIPLLAPGGSFSLGQGYTEKGVHMGGGIGTAAGALLCPGGGGRGEGPPSVS